MEKIGELTMYGLEMKSLRRAGLTIGRWLHPGLWPATLLMAAIILHLPVATVAQAADGGDQWLVELIGAGGRVDDAKGPFTSHSHALKVSNDWQRSLADDDYRLTRVRKVTQTSGLAARLGVDDKLLMKAARAVANLDSTLRRTKAVASYSGMPFPTAGNSTGELKRMVELSYGNAKALKDKQTEFTGQATENLFSNLDAIVEGMMAPQLKQEQGRLAALEEDLKQRDLDLNDQREQLAKEENELATQATPLKREEAAVKSQLNDKQRATERLNGRERSLLEEGKALAEESQHIDRLKQSVDSLAYRHKQRIAAYNKALEEWRKRVSQHQNQKRANAEARSRLRIRLSEIRGKLSSLEKSKGLLEKARQDLDRDRLGLDRDRDKLKMRREAFEKVIAALKAKAGSQAPPSRIVGSPPAAMTPRTQRVKPGLPQTAAPRHKSAAVLHPRVAPKSRVVPESRVQPKSRVAPKSRVQPPSHSRGRPTIPRSSRTRPKP